VQALDGFKDSQRACTTIAAIPGRRSDCGVYTSHSSR